MLKAKPGQSLAGHIGDTVYVANQYWHEHESVLAGRLDKLNLCPRKTRQLLLFIAATHDAGKASNRWQYYIDGYGPRITHAAPSLIVAAAGFGINQPDQIYQLLDEEICALQAILSHHGQLYSGAFQSEYIKALGTLELKGDDLVATVVNACEPDNPYATNLFGMWKKGLLRQICYGFNLAKWARALEDHVTFIQRPSEKIRLKSLYSLFHTLLRLADHEASRAYGQLDKAKPERVWGTILSSDSFTEYRPLLAINFKDTFTKFSTESVVGKTPNPIQTLLAEEEHPNVILKAPCGCGKTGAALLYASRFFANVQANRMILVLPTQVTSNSMYSSLQQRYLLPPAQVGIYHSELEDVLRQTGPRETEQEDYTGWFKDEKFLNSFYHKPVTVSTIDHLLYSLLHCHKYADRAFGNLLTSVVIFDEIHYYDNFTLPKIGEALSLLRRLQIPHLVMTATLPTAFVTELNKRARLQKTEYKLINALDHEPASAQAEPYQIQSQHQPMLVGKEVNPMLLALLTKFKGMRQMIIVNQVERAKRVALILKEKLPYENVVCYHSEFTRSDRILKEQVIHALFKPRGSRTTAERNLIQSFDLQNTDEVILVCTQVCELSLDISADVMYSEIAPADSLVQRGGRLHRRGTQSRKEKCSCSYCQERSHLDQDHEYTMYLFPLPQYPGAQLPYQQEQLKATWENAPKVFSYIQVDAWIDAVYPEIPALRDPAMHDMIMEDVVFGRTPLERYGRGDVIASEGSFRVRDIDGGVSVVPVQFLQDFEQPETILRKYAIRLRWSKLSRLPEGSLRFDQDHNCFTLDLPYCWATGLSFP